MVVCRRGSYIVYIIYSIVLYAYTTFHLVAKEGRLWREPYIKKEEGGGVPILIPRILLPVPGYMARIN